MYWTPTICKVLTDTLWTMRMKKPAYRSNSLEGGRRRYPHKYSTRWSVTGALTGNKPYGSWKGGELPCGGRDLERVPGGIFWHHGNGHWVEFPPKRITFDRGDVSWETCPSNSCPAKGLKWEQEENQLWNCYASERTCRNCLDWNLRSICIPSARTP